MFTKTNFYLV